MNKHTLAALIVLNIVLFFALVVTTPPAVQAQGLRGASGKFLMVSGDVRGRQDQEAIYIVEINTGAMMAMTYDPRTRTIRRLGMANIAADIQGGSGGRR